MSLQVQDDGERFVFYVHGKNIGHSPKEALQSQVGVHNTIVRVMEAYVKHYESKSYSDTSIVCGLIDTITFGVFKRS